MNIVKKLICGSAVLAFVGVATAVAQQGQKAGQLPDCIRVASPGLQNKLFHLQYESWVKKTDDSDRYLFDRCVFNHRLASPLFIDWQGTGAKGVTNDEGLVKGWLEAPTNQHDDKKTVLVYGAARSKLDTTYKEVRAPQAGITPTQPGSFRSYAKMGLYLGVDGEIEPAHVVNIDVEFESSVMKIGDGRYLYTYSWRDRLASKRKQEESIYVAWPDKFVEDALRNSSKQKYPSELFEERRGGYQLDNTPPTFRMVTVNFHAVKDGPKQSLGTARVSIVLPKNYND
jgi:hypothetical protein